jgi:hypothetical protein
MRNIRLLTRGPLDGEDARNVMSFIEESFDLGETDTQIGRGLHVLLSPRRVKLWRDGVGALCVLVDQPAKSSEATGRR